VARTASDVAGLCNTVVPVFRGVFGQEPCVPSKVGNVELLESEFKRHGHAPVPQQHAAVSSEAEATPRGGVAPVWRANVLYRTFVSFAIESHGMLEIHKLY
jgi:hypothetical protein